MNRQQAIKAEPDIEAFKAAALRCPLPSAVELIGEKWAFLILRGALNGLEHFEQFQAALGIARNILSNRLAKLVEHGILDRQPCADDRRRIEYRLTPKGFDLLPAMVALRQWGQKYGTEVVENPVLADERDRLPIGPVSILAHDGRVLTGKDLRFVEPPRSASARTAPSPSRRPRSTAFASTARRMRRRIWPPFADRSLSRERLPVPKRENSTDWYRQTPVGGPLEGARLGDLPDPC